MNERDLLNAELIAELIAKAYIHVNGIDQSALHNSLNKPKSAKVKYIDQIGVKYINRLDPKLNGSDLAYVDIIDCGEFLGIEDVLHPVILYNMFIFDCHRYLLFIKYNLKYCVKTPNWSKSLYLEESAELIEKSRNALYSDLRRNACS